MTSSCPAGEVLSDELLMEMSEIRDLAGRVHMTEQKMHLNVTKRCIKKRESREKVKLTTCWSELHAEVQYRACLAITGGIQGTSRKQLYNELGLHSLVKRRWHNKLVFFIKL